MNYAIRRLFMPLFAAAALGSVAQTASAEEFTILIYETPADLASRNGSNSASYWNTYNEFAGALAKEGVLRGGSALSETTASVVRGKGGADGAVQGARLGGYFVIDVADIEAAKAWARRAPAKAVAVEVRPHRPNPTMGMDAGKNKPAL
jgi:hypothetical protein